MSRESVFKPMGIPKLINYRNWTIWRWTGWKGEKFKVLDQCRYESCIVCGQSFVLGENIYVNQSIRGAQHWICHYPDNRPDRLVAQWVAVKLGCNPTRERYLYACAGAHTAGEYKRGECFDIGSDPIITEHSCDEDKEQEKRAAYHRLCLLIDRLEND